VDLEDVNRTALVRLKMGLEEQGLTFPYNIPPKNSKKDRGVGGLLKKNVPELV
jgi:hypothetical protein